MKPSNFVHAIILALACAAGTYLGRQFALNDSAQLRKELRELTNTIDKRVIPYLKSVDAELNRLERDARSRSEDIEHLARQQNEKNRQFEAMLGMLGKRTDAILSTNPAAQQTLSETGKTPQAKTQKQARAQQGLADLGNLDDVGQAEQRAKKPADLTSLQDELRKQVEKHTNEALNAMKDVDVEKVLKDKAAPLLAKVILDGTIDPATAGIALGELGKADKAISKAIGQIDQAIAMLRTKRREIELSALPPEVKQELIAKIDQVINQLEDKKSDLRDLQTKVRIAQAAIGALLALGCLEGNMLCCGAILSALLDMNLSGDIDFSSNKGNGSGDSDGSADGEGNGGKNKGIVSRDPGAEGTTNQPGAIPAGTPVAASANDDKRGAPSNVAAKGGNVTVTVVRGTNGYSEVRFTPAGGREQVALAASNQAEHNMIERLREAGVAVVSIALDEVVYERTGQGEFKLFRNGNTINEQLVPKAAPAAPAPTAAKPAVK